MKTTVWKAIGTLACAAALTALAACAAAEAEPKGGARGGGGGVVEAYEGDLAFLDGLVPHHRLGLLMADEALAKAKRPEVRALAKAMKAEDAAAIRELTARRAALTAEPETPPVDAGGSSAIPAGAGFERRWAAAAIRHEQATLDLAIRAEAESERPEIRALAQRVAADARGELAALRRMARALQAG